MYKLMIVDDEEIVREGLTKLIEMSNTNFKVVCEAQDGKKGVEMARITRPDLIIADIKMPFMNGLEMIDCIKEFKHNTKFIILSAYPDFNYARHAIKSGVIDYLMKPVNRMELISLLKSVEQKIDNEKAEESKLNKLIATDNNSYISTNENIKERKIIEAAKQYIITNFSIDLSLESVASYVNMNPNYFSGLFKEESGENFIDFLTRVRIEKAKELLDDYSLKVYEISEMVGYYSPKHFSKVFKRVVGITPIEYRER